MTTKTERELVDIEAVLARIAKEKPEAVLFAMVECLIDVACGENPALRSIKRLQFYRGILQTLKKRGVS
jgi:hypothetical protein